MVVAASLVGPFFVARHGQVVAPDALPIPATHDMAQHVTVLRQFDEAVRDGDLYPRWQPDFNRGYGLPWLNFYPPGFYYLAEIFQLVTLSPVGALLAACLILMAGSGHASYALSRTFFPRVPSALGAAFYMITPYHTLDLYLRGALPELTGFLLAPLVFLFAYKAGERGRAKHIAALGLILGVYLICHFPVAYLLTLTTAVYAAAWSAWHRDVKIALRIGAGAVLGGIVSAAYWMPAMVERVYVREPFSEVFPYHQSYIRLFSGGDSFTQFVNHSFLGLAAAIGLGVVILFLLRSFAGTQVRLFTALALLTLFMVTPWSLHVSRLIPNINAISFAWRWMVIVSCCAAFVVAFAAAAISKAGRAPLRWALMAALAGVFVFNGWVSVRVMANAFTTGNQEAPVQRDEYGFIPAGAVDPPSLPDGPDARLSSGAGRIEILAWRPLRREILVETPEAQLLRLKTFTFPGWTARVDGRVVALQADADGAQLIPIAAGSHRVRVTFENTRTRIGAMALSLLAISIAAGLIIAGRE